MAKINIYGRLHNNTTEGIIAGADQLMDDGWGDGGKKQSEINQELKQSIGSAAQALSTSEIDAAIAAAKAVDEETL